ncbi:hypothetical protein BH23VER1_BH23VER1_26470 [soil metagenome]
MKNILLLVAGLGLGIVGAILFQQSLPPEEGSLAEDVERSQIALAKAETRIAELEAQTGLGKGERTRRTVADGTRAIAEDIRAGRRVDLDDVFATFKPVLRDLDPLFDRIRVRDQKRRFDSLAGEISRKYDLDPGQEAALLLWFDQKAEENAARYSAVVNDEASGMEDFIRASRDENRDDGLDEFMDGILSGEAREQFREDRMLERVGRVQQEADRKMHRLDTIVGLDESQKDEVFVLMARGSPDFDPNMRLDGIGSDTAPLGAGADRDAAVLEVLRPDQRQVFEQHQADQRAKAEADLSDLGLSLPDDWDLFDRDGF